MVAGRVDLGGAEAYGLAVTDSAVWALSYQQGSLHAIDPGSREVVRSVQLGPHAAVALADGDRLWVAAYGLAPVESRLYRLDAATGALEGLVVAGELCCDLAAGDGFAWALDPSGSVLRIDPASDAVAERYPVAVDRNAHSNLVHSGGRVWVSSDTTPLQRLDPATGGVDELDVGGGVPFFARDGRVWGASAGEVWVVDDASGAVVRRIAVPDSMEILSLEAADGLVWVGMRHPGYVGAVLLLDEATGEVLGELRDVTIPARMAVGFGHVWVTDSGSSHVLALQAVEG